MAGRSSSNDALDRTLLEQAGVDRVVMLPTADAFEQPGVLVDAALAWGSRMGVAVEPLMVLTRAEAECRSGGGGRGASAVFLAGDSASHLRSVLKDTPLFDALASCSRAVAR